MLCWNLSLWLITHSLMKHLWENLANKSDQIIHFPLSDIQSGDFDQHWTDTEYRIGSFLVIMGFLASDTKNKLPISDLNWLTCCFLNDVSTGKYSICYILLIDTVLPHKNDISRFLLSTLARQYVLCSHSSILKLLHIFWMHLVRVRDTLVQNVHKNCLWT